MTRPGFALAIALDVGARFDRKAFMLDIAEHLGGGGKKDVLCPNNALHGTVNMYGFRIQSPDTLASNANDHYIAPNLASQTAVDLNLTGRYQSAINR